MTERKPKRKIIQINVSNSDHLYTQWALCDDGTVWFRDNNGDMGRPRWNKVNIDDVLFG